MAMKMLTKTEEESAGTSEKKAPALQQMTTINFRTRRVLKKKAEGVLDDMGLSMSAALNMFLAQVVRDQGLPFLPSVKRNSNGDLSANGKTKEELDNAGYLALEELWDEL